MSITQFKAEDARYVAKRLCTDAELFKRVKELISYRATECYLCLTIEHLTPGVIEGLKADGFGVTDLHRGVYYITW